MFNPAAAISQVVAGNLGPGQFFNVIAGEMVGAFLGGLTIYFLYMPQLYKAGEKVRGWTVNRLTENLGCCWGTSKPGQLVSLAGASVAARMLGQRAALLPLSERRLCATPTHVVMRCVLCCAVHAVCRCFTSVT